MSSKTVKVGITKGGHSIKFIKEGGAFVVETWGNPTTRIFHKKYDDYEEAKEIFNSFNYTKSSKLT